MTEPHFPNNLTVYLVPKEKASIPDPRLVLSAFTDYVQECQSQLHTLGLEKHNLQNQVFALSERNNELEEDLADANNKLAYANEEIRDLRCSQHPESRNGDSWEDWENRRYDE